MTALRTSQKKRPKNAWERLRERYPFFLFLSCLIHATLIILLAIFFATHFTRTKQHQEEEPPPPEVTLQLPPASSRPFIAASESNTATPEKNSPFESNENTKAASEQPADGSIPLPSQQGVVQPALELQNQRHTQGEKAAASAGNQAPAQSPSLPSQASQQSAPQKPVATPQPTATPINSPTPQATPTPSPSPSEMKMLEPQKQSTPQPTPQTTTTQTAAQQSQQSPARQASAPGSSGATKGYQPETRQTVIRGNISNRGRSSVSAEATPIGRYKKAVADAIGSRWYYYVDERMGLLSIGTVSVSFKVTSAGRATDVKVLSSNGNESLTDCSLRSIMDAKLPIIPPDVAKTLPNGTLEIDYSFTVY
jgi:TonB family protein